MESIRAYVIHGSRLLAEVLACALETCLEVRLIGFTTSFGRARRDLAMNPADIVLVDYQIGEEVSVEVIGDLRREFSNLRVLPLGVPSEKSVLRLLEAGASGYVLRSASLAELVETVQAVRREEPPCSIQIAAHVCSRVAELARQKDRRQELGRIALSRREAEVLDLISQGMSNKEIAKGLSISLATVKNHVHRILKKLEAPSRRQAILRAYEAGLVESFLPISPR